MNILLISSDAAGGRHLEEMLRPSAAGVAEVKRVPDLEQALNELERVGTEAVIVDLALSKADG